LDFVTLYSVLTGNGTGFLLQFRGPSGTGIEIL